LQTPFLQAHEVRDPNWDAGGDALYQVLVLENMLVSVVFDPGAQRFVYLKSTPAETVLTALQEGSGTLFDEIEPGDITLFTNVLKTVLIPAELYNAGDERAFFTLNHPLAENEVIYEQKLDKLNAVMLFAIPEVMEQALSSLGMGWGLQHLDGCWLEGLSRIHRDREGAHVHVDLQPDMISVAVYNGDKLMLYNTFSCSTPEDRLYFVMFVSEQLKISPQRDTYFLSGQVNRSDDTYLLFARYLAKMQMEARPDFYRYALPFHELPEHFYFKAYCTPLSA
jgi:hypothetical protein